MYVCLWLGSYVISGTVISRSAHMSNVVIILTRLWLQSAKPALICNCFIGQNHRWQPIWVTIHLNLAASDSVLCPEGIMWPHSHSLINVKSLHTGCQRAVGGAADEVACTMWGCIISVSHIHHTVANHSHTVRGLCGHTCVRLCVYSSWWLMQGKSRWVKTTSVRCSAERW